MHVPIVHMPVVTFFCICSLREDSRTLSGPDRVRESSRREQIQKKEHVCWNNVVLAPTRTCPRALIRVRAVVVGRPCTVVVGRP